MTKFRSPYIVNSWPWVRDSSPRHIFWSCCKTIYYIISEIISLYLDTHQTNDCIGMISVSSPIFWNKKTDG